MNDPTRTPNTGAAYESSLARRTALRPGALRSLRSKLKMVRAVNYYWAPQHAATAIGLALDLIALETYIGLPAGLDVAKLDRLLSAAQANPNNAVTAKMADDFRHAVVNGKINDAERLASLSEALDLACEACDYLA